MGLLNSSPTSAPTWTISGSGATSRSARSTPRAAVPALEPVPVAPGVGPGRPVRHSGQGVDQPDVRRALLLGHGDVRPAVPDLHVPAARPERLAVSVRHPGQGAGAGPCGQSEGRVICLAHDQRRGGVGVLRGGHGPVPHQRRDRPRHREVRGRHRGSGLPVRVRGGDPRRDRPAVVRPGLLLRAQGRALLHPPGHRAGRIHHGGQQQHVHEPDGSGEPAVRRRRGGTAAGGQPGPLPGPRTPNRTRAWRGGGLATGGRPDVRAL